MTQKGLPSSLDIALTEAERNTFGLSDDLQAQIKQQQQRALERKKTNAQPLPSLGLPKTPEMPEMQNYSASSTAGNIPFMSEFQAASQRYGVPVNVLMGLAQQESGFNPTALGSQTKWGRAKGLMQYLDSTAAGMNINPYDPAQSIDAAARQLKQRLDKGYSMIDAVREHFAGPDRKQWGAKTHTYGIEVMGRASKFGNIGGQQAQSQQQIQPGRMIKGADAYKGLRLKSNEAIAGGGVNSHTLDFAHIVQNGFGNQLRHFSGFNDSYHAGTTSKHAHGNAFDFSLNGMSGPKAEAHLHALAKQHGYQIRILDEYTKPSKNATGGHMHVTVVGRIGGAKQQPAQAQQQSDRFIPLSADARRRMDQAIASGEDSFIPFGGAKPIKLPKQVFEARKKKIEEADADKGFISDTGNLLGRGFTGAAIGLREVFTYTPLGRQVVKTVDRIDKFLTGKTSEEILSETKKHYTDALSSKMDGATKKHWVVEPGDTINGEKATSWGFGPAWSDPRAYYAGVVESMPEMALTMGGSLSMAKSAFTHALKSGATREVAAKTAAKTAAIAGGILEGGLAGGHSSVNVREQINGLSDEILMKSDAIQALIAEGKTLPEARKIVADNAASKAFMIAGVATGMFGGMGDRAIAKIITEGTTSRFKSAMRGAVAEGVFEEMPQSASQAMAENFAMQDANPDQRLMQGVANQAAGGLVLGGIMGGGIGAATHTNARQDDAGQPTAPEPDPITPAENVTPRRQGAIERSMGGAETLDTEINREIEALNNGQPDAPSPTAPSADQWLGSPGDVVEVSPKEDPDSTYTLQIEGYQDGEVFARDQDGAPVQFGPDDVIPRSTAQSEQVATPADTTTEQKAEPSVAEQVTQAFSNIASGMNDAALERVASQLNEGKEVRYTKPESIEAAKSNDNYNVTANDDGSLSVIGVRTPDGTWVGVQPTAETKTEQAQAGQNERALADMTDAELRERIKYLARQAKTNGGWDKRLMAERRKVETEIARKGRENTPSINDNINGSAKWDGMTPAERQATAEKAGIDTNTAKDLSSKAWGVIDTVSMDKLALSMREPKAKKQKAPKAEKAKTDIPDIAPEANNQPIGEVSEFERLIIDAHLNNPRIKPQIIQQEVKSSGRSRSEVFAQVSEIVKRIPPQSQTQEVSEPQADAVPSAEKTTNIAQESDAVADQPSASTEEVAEQPKAKSEAKDATTGKDGKAKWFTAQDKAQAFIDKKKLNGSHEVKKVSNTRYEIHPIEAKGEELSVANAADTVAETETVQPKEQEVEKAEPTNEKKLPIVKRTLRVRADGRAESLQGVKLDTPRAQFIYDLALEQLGGKRDTRSTGERDPDPIISVTVSNSSVIAYDKDGVLKNFALVGDKTFVATAEIEIEKETVQSQQDNAITGDTWSEIIENLGLTQEQVTQIKAKVEREINGFYDDVVTHTKITLEDLNDFIDLIVEEVAKTEVEVDFDQLETAINEAIKTEFSFAMKMRNVRFNGLALLRTGVVGADHKRHTLTEKSKQELIAKLKESNKQIKAIPFKDFKESDMTRILDAFDFKPEFADTVVEAKTEQAQTDDGFTTIKTKHGEELAVRTADLNDTGATNLQSYSTDGKKRLNKISRDSIVSDVPAAVSTEEKVDPFADNTLFTADKVAAARARIKSKLGQINSGIDPEMLVDGMTIAGAYIESGVRKFSDYAKAMVDDLGDGVKPYLLSFWEGARNYPGLDTTGMTSTEDSAKEHAALLNPEDLKTDAVGQIAEKPQVKTKKTGAKGDMVITQDWGVAHIDGYSQSSDRETGNDTKDAFLKETRNYLNSVADALRSFGFEPHEDRKGKPEKPVNVNESGQTDSGDVSLTMRNAENGNNIYITIGSTTLRNSVPSTASGIAIMCRVGQDGDRYAKRGQNTWAPVDLSANDLASLVNSRVRPAKVEEKQNAGSLQSEELSAGNQSGVEENATTGNGNSEPMATGVAETSERADRSKAVPTSTESTGRSGTGSVQSGQSAPSTPRDSGAVRVERGTADTLKVGDKVVFNRDYDYVTAGKEYTVTQKSGAKLVLSSGASQTSLDVRRLNLALAKNLEITVTTTTPESKTAESKVADPATAETSPKPELDRDFDLTNEDIGTGGLVTKYKENIAAIRILKAMSAENRVATPEERKQIARYVGWGALKGVFDKDNKQWSKEYAELKELLTDAEYKAARASVRNAFYTSPMIVNSMYAALQRMGFDAGRVLEPSVGVGNFFGLMPAGMRKKSQLHGVELDPLTSQIAAALYPSAKIAQSTGFQDFQVPSEYFDVAIGNPPFGDEPIVDNDRSPYSGSSIHNYFFAKSIDKVRPGGLMVMVVSSSFMDAKNNKTRKWISERADLVGAVRLPSNAFKENAGTEVITDILVFQKPVDGIVRSDTSWVDVGGQEITNGKTGETVTANVNNRFINNPQDVLGDVSADGGMYGGNNYTVKANGDVGVSLISWTKGLPQNLYKPIARTHEMEAADISIPDGVKVGSFFVGENGSISVRGPDALGNRTATEWTAPNAKAAERMKSMIGLRDALREQMRIEKSADTTTEQIEANRAKLNQLYDDFRKNYGFLNDQTNRRLFLDDTESALLLALEFDYDKGVSKAVATREEIDVRDPSAVKADIFNRRVMFPPADNIKVSNANDALLASLNYKASLDLPYMATLYDKTEAEIIEELGDVVYNDPINGHVMADEYLAGDVKTKLAEAQEAAKDNPAFKKNVEALKKVIPADKLPSEIHAALGANFIPSELFEQFAKEITGADHKIAYIKATGQWVVDPRGETNASLNVGKWGISKMPATTIFARTMAGQGVVVTETVRLGGGKTETRVLEKETEAAREKQSALKSEWQRWLWADPDRADRAASIYNDKMNRIVVRQFNGDHMTFPGMSPAISLLEHQKNAVWRALQSRQVLLDHTVGAGKTFEIVALFMEMRRLGIARKPFIAVPNHLTLQWRSEFSRLYPAANVLAATPEDFSKGNREKFFSKIVTGDWDAVIVGHSSLKKIALPAETEKAVLEEQIVEIAESIEEIKRARGDRNIIRDMEGIKARLEARMKQRVQNLGDRDKVVTFDELGVDAFAIDELHEFKNLFYNSTMERVPGMGNPSGSDKAFDLFVKLQWMFNTFGDKAPIAGATGTPVSNSLVEMFNMQRLLQYPTLKKDGLHVFDAWAKQFGSVESLYEVAPSGTGYRQSSRFAKFKNLPALMSHYQTFADTVTLDDLKAQEEAQGKAFPVPKVFGGRPQNIVAKRSPDVASFMGTPQLDIQDDQVQFGFNAANGDTFEITKSEQGDHFNVIVVQDIDGAEVKQHVGTAKTEEDARLMLVEQALSPKIYVDPKSILGQFSNLKELNKKTKGKVNALSLTGQANKVGLDYRLVDPTAPDFAGSKINKSIERMMATYHKWTADKGAQLIFCDLSVPKSARSGFGNKERRVYVRDEKGGIAHKKGTMHTVEGLEELPFFVVKEGKEFTIYDAATGLRIRSGLPSKVVATEWTKQTLEDEGKRQRWIDARDALGDLEQDAIDDYNNANEINVEETEAISLSDIAGASGAAGFSVYDDIKTKLIAQGIPEREIAFIHDYSTPIAKEKLFRAVNNGTIRFLLGSTPKMGAGTNVQKRLVGLHHIDAPWRPSDLEQREGRIIRRGNVLYERDPDNFEVEIYRYATEQTYDTRRWQILEHKSRGIEQLRNYDGSVNEIDDIEGEAANAADMKAAASGDPLILEETQLRNDVRRLESLQAAHADSTQMLFRRARENQRFADEIGPRQLKEFQDLQATADKNPVVKDQFAGLTVHGSKIADREDAVKAIQKALVSAFSAGTDATFKYRGVEFTLDNLSGYVELNSPTGRLDNFDVSVDKMPSAAGFLTRFANYINRLPSHIEDITASIEEANQDAVQLREQADQPFNQADELTTAREAHKRIQRRLIAKGPDIPANQKPLLDQAMERQKNALRDLGLADAMEEFVGNRQNSRGQAGNTGTTTDQVRDALSDRFGAKTVAELERAGVLTIIDTYSEPGIEGFTENGKVALVADALTPESIIPTFLHELGGHVGMQGTMKPAAYQNLMDQFNKLVAANDPLALEAKRLAERETGEQSQQAEYLPYLVTVAARAQNNRPGVKTLINRIVSAVKAWVFDKLGINLTLNANDILALSERMVKSIGGTAASEQRFSRADQTKSSAFKKWFGDSKVVDESGNPIVRYHGTRDDWNQWDVDRAGGLIHTTDDKDIADRYAQGSGGGRKRSDPVYQDHEGNIFEPDGNDYVNKKDGTRLTFRDIQDMMDYGDINAVYPEGNIKEVYVRAEKTLNLNTPEGVKVLAGINADTNFGRNVVQQAADGNFHWNSTKFEFKNKHWAGDLVPKLKELGYDSIAFSDDGHQTLSVFDSNQIKSTIDNVGTFDAENPDIRFSRADNDLGPVSQEEYGSKLNQWWTEAKQLPADKLTNAMKKGGLSLVPLRPMLNEIAKDIPAAKLYLRIKEKMDAMRNEWHGKTDAVAQNWLKYRIKNREENRALMEIMHESTLMQVDPSKPFESLMTALDVKALESMSNDHPRRKGLEEKVARDEQRQIEYDKLKERFDALSPAGVDIFNQVRDAYSDMADAFDNTLIANMEKAINVRVKKAEREYNRELERIKDEGLTGQERDDAIAAADRALKNAKTKISWNRKARLTQLRQQFETQRLQGPYFPLARFGDFFVTVRDAETGEVLSFSRFDNSTDQRRFADEMRKDDDQSVEVGALSDAATTRKAVDPNFVADVEDILADLPNAEQVKDEVWQRYLASLPDMSTRKARIHRKGRAGYNADAVRAFGHQLFHGSHQLARMAHSMDLEDALDQARDEARETKDPTRSGLIVNEMEKRHAFVMNPTGGSLATWASSFAFIWYLAGSPKAAIMNLFQTPIMGVPILGAYAGGLNGMARAGKELSSALVDFTHGKGFAARSSRLSDDERKAMETGYETGIIEKTQGHELAGVAESGVEYNAVREKVMKVISWGFHHTERLNREVTFLAAYRMARTKGEPHEKAIETAADLTWKTHFDYSNTSRPRLMHNDTMKILLVFRNFQVNMLFRLFRDTHQAFQGETKEARKEALTQLAGITGMMMLNAGITGTWLFGIAMLMAGLFADDGEDPEELLKKGMVDTLGPNLAGMALYGVPGHLTGTSLSASVGMPDLWFRSPDSEKEGEEALQYWQSQLLGAVPGIAAQMARGLGQIGKGQEYRGIETMLPKMLKDPMKAYRYATEGAKNMKGDIVTDVDWSDVVKQATGFTPARVSEQYKINNTNYNKQAVILSQRKKIMDAFYEAEKKSDSAALEKVLQDVEKHNAKNPDQAITAKGLMQSVKTRERASDGAVGGIRYNTKLRERIVDEQAPAIYK